MTLDKQKLSLFVEYHPARLNSTLSSKLTANRATFRQFYGSIDASRNYFFTLDQSRITTILEASQPMGGGGAVVVTTFPG